MDLGLSSKRTPKAEKETVNGKITAEASIQEDAHEEKISSAQLTDDQQTRRIGFLLLSRPHCP
jgi:hypothetical protein